MVKHLEISKAEEAKRWFISNEPESTRLRPLNLKVLQITIGKSKRSTQNCDHKWSHSKEITMVIFGCSRSIDGANSNKIFRLKFEIFKLGF